MYSTPLHYTAFTPTKRRLMLLLMAISLLLAMLPAQVARAATTRLVSKNGIDSGDCTVTACLTIGYAISQATTNDTISIGAGTYAENLSISKNLSLSGAGKAATIIDGNHAAGVVGIAVGISVSIAGVTLQNGIGTGGGAIVNNGTLALNNSAVSGNNSLGSPGGGIYNTGALTIDQSIITNNKSSGAGGGIYNHGGIVTLTGSNVISNTVAGFSNIYSGGGGIYSSGGRMTLTNSTISDNRVSVTGHGAGIDVITTTLEMIGTTVDRNSSALGDGGGIFAYTSTLTLQDSTISNNTGLYGGGIEIYHSGSSVTLNNSRVSGNTAANSGGGIANASGVLTVTGSTISDNVANGSGDGGGGIWSAGDTTLIRSTLSGNVAAQGTGGGIDNTQGAGKLLLDATSVRNNTSDSFGGGIYSVGGTVTLRNNSAVSNNTVSAHFGAHGGGIFLLTAALTMDESTIDGNSSSLGGGGGIAAYTSTLTLNNSTVRNNSAPNSAGGGIFIIYGASSLTMRQSTISANIAGDLGGGIYNDLSTITLSEDSKVISNTAGTRGGGGIYNNGIATLRNSEISGNTASQAGGGGIKNIASATLLCDPCTISGNRAAGNGGGIESVSISTIALNNSTVNSNTAIDGGGISDAAVNTMSIQSSTIDSNTALGSGGGISILPNATAIITGGTVAHNRASSGSAGGIFNKGALTLRNTIINDNEADDAGGGLYSVSGGISTLVGVHVLNNRAINLSNTPGNRNGGGIASDGPMTVTDSIVSGNSASGGGADNVGGGIFSGDRMIIINTTISNNKTDSTNGRGASGGGIINYGRMSLRDSLVDGNSALAGTLTLSDTAGTGGGIYNTNQNNSAGGQLDLINTTISNNSALGNNGSLASTNGGGLFSDGIITITGSLISNNHALDGPKRNSGGGISNEGIATINSTAIVNNRVGGAPTATNYGGGITNNTGNMQIGNSTISGNQVNNGNGGGIRYDNTPNDTLVIGNSTISNNTSGDGGGIVVANVLAPLTIANSILAGNRGSSNADCAGQVSQIKSQGFNLFGSVGGCAIARANTDIITNDVRLAPLANNGGPTPTHALRPGSPALDAGDDASCPAADQRGITRPQGAHCDIGAYEGGGAAARLAFSVEPGRAQVDQPLPVQPVVVAVDDQGNGVSFNGVITLSLVGGTAGAQLLGTTSTSALNGRAAFSDLRVDRAGENYQLVAIAEGLSTATSGPFAILTPPLPPNIDPPSEVEVNDTLEESNQLLFDSQDHSARTGLISATVTLTADIDLYRFEVAPKSRVRIRLTGLNAGPNHLPSNYDMLLLPAIGAESDEGTLDLGKITDVARNFIARNFIARNFIARNFIARNFIGDTLGALSDNSGLQDEQIDTFVQNGGTYYLIVYGADEQQSSATNRYRLDVERHIGELPLPPNTAHPISSLLSNGLPAQPDAQVRTIYLYNSKRIGTQYSQDPAELQARDELNSILTSSNVLTDNVLMDADAATGKGKGIAIDLSTALLSTDATTMTALYDQWDDIIREPSNDPANNPAVTPRANPLFANEVAQQIRYVLDYALTHLYTGTTDIVLVGGDTIIPFYRVPDETTFANESDYPFQLHGTGLMTDTALIGGMTHSFIQTDNFYASRKPIFWRNRGLYVPDLGIGRLVERPSEIMHYLRSYIDSPSSSRFTIDARFTTAPNAGAAFVSGYDFLDDQVEDLAKQFDTYGLKNYGMVTTTLGLTYTLNVLDDKINAWDLRQFGDAWLSGQLPRLTATVPYSGPQVRYDLMSLNSHFSHYGADPAIASTATFSAAQLLNPAAQVDALAFFKKDGRPTLIYSVGCHSGLSATDQAFSAQFYQADFPQAVLKQGGNWIGNTGYAYGDSDLVAFSERLSVLFTRAIGRAITETDTLGQGKYLGAPIGESLARAKWNYLPKGAGSFSIYDEKVVEQMTLYGLPFIRVKVPKPTPVPPPPPRSQVWESQIDPTGILTTRVITLDNTFSQITLPSGDNMPQVSSSIQDSFYPNGAPAIKIEDRLANGQPVLPLLRYDITLQPSNTGLGLPIPRAVRLILATSTNRANYNPHVTTTITDTFAKSPKEPPLTPRKTWLPALPYTFLQTVQHPGATNVITTDNLLVIPAQFSARNSKKGTLRQYTRMVFEITYVVPGSQAATPQLGPLISRAQISAPNRQGTARLRATVFAGQGGPLQVSAVYTTDGIKWYRARLALVSRRNGRYEARIPAKRGNAIYAFFEARDRVGNSTIISAQR